MHKGKLIARYHGHNEYKIYMLTNHIVARIITGNAEYDKFVIAIVAGLTMEQNLNRLYALIQRKEGHNANWLKNFEN